MEKGVSEYPGMVSVSSEGALPAQSSLRCQASVFPSVKWVGRWGSRLSRGHPALKWEALMGFQKRDPPLRFSKLPVLLELIKPRRRWSRLSDAQGLKRPRIHPSLFR